MKKQKWLKYNDKDNYRNSYRYPISIKSYNPNNNKNNNKNSNNNHNNLNQNQNNNDKENKNEKLFFEYTFLYINYTTSVNIFWFTMAF